VRVGEGWRDIEARRETLPFAPAGEAPVDVVFGAAGEATVVVYPAIFAVRSAAGDGWRAVRPSLPPGARSRRLHAAHGLLWLATDRGLLVSASLEGPWERAAQPAGTADVRAVASDASALYVAAGAHVLAARPVVLEEPPDVLAAQPNVLEEPPDVLAAQPNVLEEPPDVLAARPGALAAQPDLVPGPVLAGTGLLGFPRASSAGRGQDDTGRAAPLRLRTPEGDPPVEQVQRATLAYLDLRPDRIAALRRGVALRGWLPIVSLRLARARDEDVSIDNDEAFTSGALRRLVDRNHRISRDFEALLSFAWDLGDIAYHPEEIDVSREAREVIKLRDDVLDEVTQLYFDRRRVLVELGARPDAPPEEKLRLRLRAAELAAGIDAWTGGWFQRARASVPHP
jgi:hypothetical protein